MIDFDQDFWFSWAYYPRGTMQNHVVQRTPRGTTHNDTMTMNDSWSGSKNF